MRHIIGFIAASASFSLAPLAGAAAFTTPATITTVYAFTGPADGQFPNTLLNVQGILYGTTRSGGTGNDGLAYKLDPLTGVKTTLHSFNFADGYNPQGRLVAIGPRLYGTANNGGSAGGGLVFSLNRATGAEAGVYAFGSYHDGSIPASGVIAVGGMLYGTTEFGGTSGSPSGGGTVFSLNPTTGAETLVHSFDGNPDGQYGFAGLLSYGGLLYGTTPGGGVNGGGVLFSLDPATGAETILHSFGAGSDGKAPYASVIRVGTTLYGTCESGGTANNGAVFRLSLTTGAEKVLYAFTGNADGAAPSQALLAVGSKLYGVTGGGGAGGNGAVFTVDRFSGGFATVYSFSGGADGGAPEAALTNVGGVLYGATSSAGPFGYGTVYSLVP